MKHEHLADRGAVLGERSEENPGPATQAVRLHELVLDVDGAAIANAFIVERHQTGAERISYRCCSRGFSVGAAAIGKMS